ncbi:MAG: hypothetical protein A3D96_00905 [Chlamydiae bacterium RIFCSPHIGHO2_12_FULL_44_59]|nr:MAG: hypothetical protein A2796_00480 [Chlamydiae bacterium RIFCSPHIGHO2_01_FULL_44_39]OGN59243.1 MAG: hypothetical protein A3C42_03945 [Chlamydiae bacterium RIFCSPHIGHO2_02_FULL_45_9]OGN60429.1 MAG: hypothetical protein A3D96_00905 [Chlamydiae bacterium RIFCSPHIGHO2_12_FULL_44_59]OGN66550.1 MAG: hypothetical protein A2978_05090 [Chlamydiae bacterium RIFCSPLOWO2_01_FULL_44_52]OGN69799.1 MAG: hypothetical protein A3I67_06845 [Chlamydiae bacterium RIFCSPLOWO2_02_FULL_45_22]OGN70339.1 MAG: hyp
MTISLNLNDQTYTLYSTDSKYVTLTGTKSTQRSFEETEAKAAEKPMFVRLCIQYDQTTQKAEVRFINSNGLGLCCPLSQQEDNALKKIYSLSNNGSNPVDQKLIDIFHGIQPAQCVYSTKDIRDDKNTSLATYLARIK